MEQNTALRFPFGLRPAPGGAPLDPELRDAVRSAALDALRAGDSRPLLDAVMHESGCFERAEDDLSGRCPQWHVTIPVRGRLDLLAACLRGLATLRDARDFDVVLAGSDAEEPVMRDMMRDTPFLNSYVVTSAEPRGFAANCNMGVSRIWPDTDRVLFLNSDTDPSPLGSLAGAFDSALDVADAAGPFGTNVSGFQSFFSGDIGSSFFHDPSAAELCAWPRATRAPQPRLVGFALAVNLGALRAVGGWDEQFGIGNFDDDDLSLRLALWSEKPHRLAFVPSAFVRRVGSASFAALPDAEATYNAAMTRNRAKFEARWGWCVPAIREWWSRG